MFVCTLRRTLMNVVGVMQLLTLITQSDAGANNLFLSLLSSGSFNAYILYVINRFSRR